MVGGLVAVVLVAITGLAASWLVTRAGGMRPLAAIVVAAVVVAALAAIALAILLAIARS